MARREYEEGFRIGVEIAALTLGVRISELKDAIIRGEKLHGIDPPQPFQRFGQKREMVFWMADVQQKAEELKAARGKKS